MGIVFLLNEIEQLLYYQEGIENIGAKEQKFSVNPRVQFLNSFFPDNYCVFEKIIVQRLAYFFIFNVACIISQIFSMELEEGIKRMTRFETMKNKAKDIEDLTKDLFKKVQGVDFSRKPLSKGFGKYNPMKHAHQ